MADSSFFTDGGSDSGTFQTIEVKIAEAEAAKVAAQAAQAAAEQAESGVQASASQAEAAKDAAELAQAGATGSETNSASSATTAGNHAADAQKLAVNPEDSQYTLSDGSTTGYSALHYNEKASDSASAAALSAGTATTKAGEASNSAQTALLAQTAAESARDSALSALDNFEDQYLGDHSSDPTTDGDGDPLAAGMIYYNTTDSVVKVYSGSAWVVAYADGTTLVAKAGDTMSGNLTVNANIDANSLNVDSGTLVVDGSTDRVGINLGSGVSPTVPLNVAGTVRFQSTSSAGQMLEFTNYSGYSRLYRSNGHLEFQGGSSGNGILQLSNAGGFTFDGNNVWHAGNLDSILDLGITDGTNGQALKTDGSGNLSFGDVATSTAWADVTGKPTTIAGFGITDAFDGAYASLTGAPTIPTNNNQLTNGAGYITSADGGNAATLDGIDSTSFLRSDASDSASGNITFSGDLAFQSNTIWQVSSSDAATQRVDARDDGSEARMHWYGQNSSSSTSNFRHAWYGGSSYINVTADGYEVKFSGGAGGTNHSTDLVATCNGTGMARIWAKGSNQGTGQVLVSQDSGYGGGIEYNGDGSPSTTGAGSDYIALFRISNGSQAWTAKNYYGNNDWAFAGNVTAYASDERLKENIETIPNALDKVCQLRGVTFDWKDDCEDKGFMPTMKHETGVIAQEVQAVIPDAAVPAPFDDEYLTVKHEKIIPVLIEAIKELKAEIEELKKG